MNAPGWYPDPTGRWEYRWFNGNAWDETVATGAFQSTEPVQPSMPAATDESVALLEVDGTYEREPARFRLTWSYLAFIPVKRPHETRWIPLGFVASVVVAKAGDATAAGDVRVSVRGPGYVGPGVIVLTGVPTAHWVRASILRQRAITTGIPASTS